MKRLCLFAAAVTAAIVLVGVAVLPSGKPASAAGPATLSIGAVSTSGGNVRIAIDIGGTGIDAYGGVTAVLLWDPTVFTYSSFDQTGSVIPTPFCAESAESSSTGPHPAGPTGVSSGENVGCATLGAPTTATGLMGTFVLTPISGCSAIHLLTLNPPDSDANGSATQDGAGANQVNTYGTIDITVDNTGTTGCNPAAVATSTSVPPTNTPAATSTPTATGTPKTLLTVTPTFTPSPTATVAGATEPAGQTPSAPGPATGPGGGPAGGAGGAGTGTIRLPDTGTGGEASAALLGLGVIATLAASGLGLFASGYAVRRRDPRA